jgi:DNA repair photolyase
MKVKEIHSKSILSTSKIYDYVINPYVGCQHACSYCYARFIKKFSGHPEPWGDFVDIKIDAPALLIKEINKKKKGNVWVSGICDPYQPLEEKYQLTRKCLEILSQNNWPVIVQTRSPLVLRDLDILKETKNLEVGFSITTVNDEIRKIFEPKAPSIASRLTALEELHKNGINTFVMIAPILPDAVNLVKFLAGKVNYILIDRMNYHYADYIYKKHNWENLNTDNYYNSVGEKIAEACTSYKIDYRIVY